MNGKLILKARTHYGDDFDEVLAWYMLNGFVYIGNDLVVLAQEQSKAVLMGEEPKVLDKMDCWYIQYCAGEMKRLFDISPFPKEWVVFERKDEFNRKAYRYNKLKQRICYGTEA